VVALLIRTELLRIDSEGQHVVIHLPTAKGTPINNSAVGTAISAAISEEAQVTVPQLAIVIATLVAPKQRTEVEPQIAAEVRLESVLPVAVKLAARAIDPAAREIEPVEAVIVLEVGT
jgi:hypothetical protein